ncbi:MAG: hypothetical protein HKN43_14145 [Rhodothermales bacterium]|nr:hypothetical protein [Rhodothermales bacterium]
MGTIGIQTRRSANWYAGIVLLLASSFLLIGSAIHYQSDLCNAAFIILLAGMAISRREFQQSPVLTLCYWTMIFVGIVIVIAV